MSVRRASAIAVALVATIVMSSIPLSATTAGAEATRSGLGVYRGSGAPDKVAAFGTWAGTTPVYALDFLARQTWADIENVDWWLQSWAGTPSEVVYSVPMLPASGATLVEGAKGSYNSTFARLAQRFVDHGQGNAIIRLGWEFNGNWYSWSAINDPRSFALYWQQVVGSMRKVAPGLRFDWSPVLGSSSPFPLENAYPGDAYVDFIGMDVYDQGWGTGWEDPAKRWNTMLTQSYGLQWHRDFAAQHGKQMTYPEWALAQRSDGHGGGDNPLFIEKMHDWIAGNNVAYHMYFEFDVSSGEKHEMMSGNFPTAALRFLELFGGQGGQVTTTTTVAPTTTTTTAAPTTTTTVASAAPAAPTNVRGTAINRRIDLSWTGSPNPVARYEVYRATATTGPFTLVGTTTSVKYVDRRLAPRTNYSYFVKAVNFAGASSASSNVVTIAVS
jgi:hypothetical protein